MQDVRGLLVLFRQRGAGVGIRNWPGIERKIRQILHGFARRHSYLAGGRRKKNVRLRRRNEAGFPGHKNELIWPKDQARRVGFSQTSLTTGDVSNLFGEGSCTAATYRHFDTPTASPSPSPDFPPTHTPPKYPKVRGANTTPPKEVVGSVIGIIFILVGCRAARRG